MCLSAAVCKNTGEAKGIISEREKKHKGLVWSQKLAWEESTSWRIGRLTTFFSKLTLSTKLLVLLCSFLTLSVLLGLLSHDMVSLLLWNDSWQHLSNLLIWMLELISTGRAEDKWSWLLPVLGPLNHLVHQILQGTFLLVCTNVLKYW